MDQKKIGSFLKELRNGKNITQEQFAEQLGVSNRTVSRWETGSNMPDISLLVEIAEYYDISIPEIINGERKSEMTNHEEKETVEKIVEYSGNEKHQKARKLNKYFILGLACLVIVILNRQFGLLSFIFQEKIDAFVEGAICGLALLFEFIGFYNNNHDITLKERKKDFIRSALKKG